MAKMKINNEIYSKMACSWWDDDAFGSLSSLKFFVNEIRLNYIITVLSNQPSFNTNELKTLDIGCGGGYLTEELAHKGFQVTGIDPSKETIICAQKHAQDNNLNINYIHGYAENLPFESNSFSIIVCCDVLEHISDLKKVIEEISRVLTPGGIFFFETLNRTFVSKIIMKATQEWKNTAFLEPNVHIFNMFIKPKELFELFKNNNLVSKEIKGISPGINVISAYMALRKCKKGKINMQELGKKLNMKVNNNKLGQYIGYAIKEGC